MDTLKIVFPGDDDASEEWQDVTDKLIALRNDLGAKLKAKIDEGGYDTRLACWLAAVTGAVVFIDGWTDGASSDEIVARLMYDPHNSETRNVGN